MGNRNLVLRTCVFLLCLSRSLTPHFHILSLSPLIAVRIRLAMPICHSQPSVSNTRTGIATSYTSYDMLAGSLTLCMPSPRERNLVLVLVAELRLKGTQVHMGPTRYVLEAPSTALELCAVQMRGHHAAVHCCARRPLLHSLERQCSRAATTTR